jgi:hypothetical protein
MRPDQRIFGELEKGLNSGLEHTAMFGFHRDKKNAIKTGNAASKKNPYVHCQPFAQNKNTFFCFFLRL